MITLLLIGHVATAIVSLLYAAGVIGASRAHNMKIASRRTTKMWYGTLVTLVSGIVLTIVAKTSIGRLCGTLLLFLVIVLIAHYYQRTVRQKLGVEHV